MISIICACNNEKLYNEMLLPSVKKQTLQDYEIIKLNAKELGLVGAAQTLNYGASIAKGDLLLFVHQDIEWNDDKFFEKLITYSSQYNFGIAGVAGVNSNEKQVYSSVTIDIDHRQAGIKITEVKNVDTLDECLFVIKKDKFKGFTDYRTWHFYAVEYSLKCKRANENVLLFPLDVYHLSPGWSLDKTYWQTLKRVAKDFSDFKVIPTTMGQFRNNCFLKFEIVLRRLRQWNKRKIKRILKIKA